MTAPAIVFLMYHELEVPGRALVQSDPGYVRYILPQSSFRRQIDWLRENHWQGLSVAEALRFPCKTAVAITFDDGCETDLLVAAPILKEAGFHATFYVTAGFLGKPGYLSPAQLRELNAFGFEIGCHSMTHTYLNDLAPEKLNTEILDSRAHLEGILGVEVDHFSCPGGRYDQRALSLAKRAGYRSVANSHARANSPSTDPFQLGRVAIMRDTPDAVLARICSGSDLWKIRLTERAREATRTILGNKLYDSVRSRLLRKR